MWVYTFSIDIPSLRDSTPLMKPPEDLNTEAWLQKCVETTESAQVDSQTRGTLLFALSTLGSLTHDANLFQKLISEEMMQESPFYKLIPFLKYNVSLIVEILQEQSPSRDREVAPTEDSFQ